MGVVVVEAAVLVVEEGEVKGEEGACLGEWVQRASTSDPVQGMPTPTFASRASSLCFLTVQPP